MKLIDADKLIAEIERRLVRYDPDYTSAGRELKELLSFIVSLQQELSEGLHFTPLMRLIQKIPSGNWNGAVNNYARNLRDCLIKEGYRKDAEVLQGYISYMNGNNVPMATMDEQEQPEIDLEKEIECSIRFLNGHHTLENGERWYKGRYEELRDFARHFYSLRNRALEEAAWHIYKSWMGGTMNGVRNDMVELGKILNARKK